MLATRARAMWGRPGCPSPQILRTSAMEMGIFSCCSFFTILGLRSSRICRSSFKVHCRSVSWGLKPYPNIWILSLIPVDIGGRALISIPGIRVRVEGMPSSMRMRTPSTVSWSAMAMVESPSVIAWCTISRGVHVPSDALEWMWRSTVGRVSSLRLDSKGFFHHFFPGFALNTLGGHRAGF